MGNRFHMGGTLDGALTSFLPIAHRLCNEPCCRTVMRQQFWLSLSNLRKLGFQDLSDTLVVVLPRALQQRLVGCLLNQRVLKGVRCLWWYTSLVHNLRLD